MEDPLLDDAFVEKKIYAIVETYPTLGRHFMAFVVDYLVILCLAIVLVLMIVLTNKGDLFYYLLLLSIPLYKCFTEGLMGGTIGKKILGITIVNFHSYKPIGWTDSLKRNVLLLSWFLFLIYINHFHASLDTIEAQRTYIPLERKMYMVLFAYGIGYCLATLYFLISPTRRTLFDYLAQTVCVNKAATALRTTD